MDRISLLSSFHLFVCASTQTTCGNKQLRWLTIGKDPTDWPNLSLNPKHAFAHISGGGLAVPSLVVTK